MSERGRQFKVLLIHANTSMDTLIPPALATLAACLKQAGNEVKLFDTTFYNTRGFTGDDARVRTLQIKETNFAERNIYFKSTDMLKDFIALVNEYEPDLVGVSTVEVTFQLGMDFINTIKKLRPEIKTVVGGSLSMTAPERVISEDAVDIVCIGEAENVFIELCRRLHNNENYTDIPSFWIKKEGYVHKNKLGNLTDINNLPYQDWEIFDKSRLCKPMSGRIRRTGAFELTRGCAYSCTFCINEHLNNMYNNKSFRVKSIPKFIEEVKYFKDHYGLDYAWILSEMFLPTTKQRVREFAKLWKEQISLPFWCQVRVEGVDEENVRLLEEAGCVSINAGIESGNEEYRKNVLHREMSNQQLIDAFQILKKTKMQISGNSMMGFPGETREMIFETIELNRQLQPDNIMVHLFTPYRGTSLYSLSVQKGYIQADHLGGDYRSDFALNMPHISQEEILGLQRTFVMYCKFPKEMWPEIEIAEKFDERGNMKFEELSALYKKQYFEKPLMH